MAALTCALQSCRKDFEFVATETDEWQHAVSGLKNHHRHKKSEKARINGKPAKKVVPSAGRCRIMFLSCIPYEEPCHEDAAFS